MQLIDYAMDMISVEHEEGRGVAILVRSDVPR